MLRKAFILVFVVAAIISLGVFAAAAQSDDPTPVTPGRMPMGGAGMMGSRGMMGHGLNGGMMWSDDQSMITAIAEVLGMEPDALVEAIQAGQTPAEIAEAQGVELQVLHDAMFAGAEAHLTEMVAAGYLTQEQADERLAWMLENSADMPMFSGACDGTCMQDNMQGMMNMMNMMDNMHGMRGNRQGMMGHGMGWHS